MTVLQRLRHGRKPNPYTNIFSPVDIAPPLPPAHGSSSNLSAPHVSLIRAAAEPPGGVPSSVAAALGAARTLDLPSPTTMSFDSVPVSSESSYSVARQSLVPSPQEHRVAIFSRAKARLTTQLSAHDTVVLRPDLSATLRNSHHVL